MIWGGYAYASHKNERKPHNMSQAVHAWKNIRKCDTVDNTGKGTSQFVALAMYHLASATERTWSSMENLHKTLNSINQRRKNEDRVSSKWFPHSSVSLEDLSWGL